MANVLVTGSNGQLGSEIRELSTDDTFFFTDSSSLDISESQDFLETLRVKKRLAKLLVYLKREKDVAEIQKKISDEVNDKVNKYQREYFLREQLKVIRAELGMEEVAHTHSRGLTAKEAQLLVNKSELDSDEVISLLEARELSMVNFKLVDVREHMEWQMGHIKGADKLIPTSSFFPTLEESGLQKDENIIVYCHVGSRSAYCVGLLTDLGYTKIGNISNGIVSYGGEINR